MGIFLCGCCFANLSAKTNEIVLIILDIFSLFFLSMCFYTIKWKEMLKINLVLFIIMLLIIIICLILTFFLRCWRSSGVIKTSKRSAAINIATACFALSIINFIACIFEEVMIGISFSRRFPPCPIDDDFDELEYFYRRISSKDECRKKRNEANKEYYISYVTFSYMEFMIILSLCIISILKKRIINKTDDDIIPTIVRGIPADPYGRQVVVVHPDQIYGMGIENNYNYYSQNLNFGNANQHFNVHRINVAHNNDQLKVNNQNYLSKDKSYNSSSRSFA